MYFFNYEAVYMKSIVEEASSIMKAIENGWKQADKPKQFSVKILEEPEKNFFGLTVKSAKIAIMFEDKKISTQQYGYRKQQTKKPYRKRYEKEESRVQQPREQKTDERVVKPLLTKFEKPEYKPRLEKSVPFTWSDEMVNTATMWVKESLKHLGLPNVHFTATVMGRNLKIQFESPILENNSKERILFSSFAHLIAETLRNKYKSPLRGVGIILTSDA